MKIDVVYTYVSYNDPKWRKTYLKYSKKKDSVRVNSLNELELSVHHTLKYCSFVNNIYIVTDNQIPSWYNEEENVKIIFHKDIFDEYCVYPTYNSNTIECYLHKIPGLTDTFIYLNDDMFINLEVNSLFDENTNKPFAFYSTRDWGYSIESAKNKHKNNPAVYALYSTIKLAEKHFEKELNISYTHQAYVLSKKACELTWSIFQDRLQKKVKMRFRKHLSPDDLVFPLLSNIVGDEKGLIKFVNINTTKLTHYFFNCTRENLHKLDGIVPGKYNFLCINDVKASDTLILKRYSAFATTFLENLKLTQNVRFTHVLFINLPSSVDRLINIQSIDEKRFNVTKMSAYNGNALSDSVFERLKSDKTLFKGIPDTKKGEYGCWKSHVKCWKYIVDNKIEWSVIMEDDAFMLPLGNNRLLDMNIPNDADIVFVHGRSQKCRRKSCQPSIRSVEYFIDGWGTDGMCISYNCAYKLLNSVYSSTYFLPIDSLLAKLGKRYKSSFRSSHRQRIKNVTITEDLSLSLYVSTEPLFTDTSMSKKSTIN
jgi:hypothetical protein